MYAVLALCLLALVAAQQPQPCTTPPQWEANYFDYNEQSGFMVRGRLSYDATYHREHVIEEVVDGGQDGYYDVIDLFDSQSEYVYNFASRNCTRRTITRPWRNFGIPPDARSRGESYIGTSALPGAGVLATLWSTNGTRPGNDTVRVFGTWTYQACLPVRFIRHSAEYGRSNIQFFDVTAGISNPSVFIPRPECLRDDEKAMRDVLFGKTPQKIHQ